MSNRLRNILKLITVLLVLFSLVMWLYGQSRVSIQIPDSSSVKITDELGVEKAYSSDSEGVYNKRLPKGKYNVIVRSDQGSFFTHVSTKPFLIKTSVSPSLEGEAYREIIGKSPGPCGYYDENTFITHSCSGTYGDAALHLPASIDQSTTTVNNGTDIEGANLGGFFSLDNNLYALTEQSLTLPESQILATLQEVGPELVPKKNITLSALSNQKFHYATKFKDGMLIYSSDYRDFYYLDKPDSTPQVINLDLPPQEKFTGVGLSVHQNTFAVAYGDRGTIDSENLDSGEIQKGKTRIVVSQDNDSQTYSFNETYGSFALCGENRLCYYTAKSLVVYEYQGKSIKEAFRIGGVEYYTSKNDMVVAATNEGVLYIDPNSRSGKYIVTYGQYTPCGLLDATTNGVILCIIDDKSNRHSVFIEPKRAVEDRIDSQLAELASQPFIDTVSIYKNLIHITPDVGEPIFAIDPSVGSGGYISDPELVAKTAQQIKDALSYIGINQTKYTIVNTGL